MEEVCFGNCDKWPRRHYNIAIGHRTSEHKIRAAANDRVVQYLLSLAATQLISTGELPRRVATATVVRAPVHQGKYVSSTLFIPSWSSIFARKSESCTIRFLIGPTSSTNFSHSTLVPMDDVFTLVRIGGQWVCNFSTME